MKAIIEYWEDYILGEEQERNSECVKIDFNTTIGELFKIYKEIQGDNGIFIDIEGTYGRCGECNECNDVKGE